MTTLTGRGKQLIDEALDAFHRDDRPASAGAAQAALDLGLADGDPVLELAALIAQSRLALRELDFGGLEALCERAQGVASRTGDPSAAVMPLHMRAEATRLQGDNARARPLYEQSIDLNRSLGSDGMVAVELHNIAYVDKADGDLDVAEARFRESAQMTMEGGGGSLLLACVIGLGAVAARRGDGTRAVRLLAAGTAAMAAAGEIVDPADEPELTGAVAEARALLGADADRVWADGAALSVEEAVREALD